MVGPYVGASGSTPVMQIVGNIPSTVQIAFEPFQTLPDTHPPSPETRQALWELMLALLNITEPELDRVVADPSILTAAGAGGGCRMGLCTPGPGMSVPEAGAWIQRVSKAAAQIPVSFPTLDAVMWAAKEGACPRFLMFKAPYDAEATRGVVGSRLCDRSEVANAGTPTDCVSKLSWYVRALSQARASAPDSAALQRIPRAPLVVMPVRQPFRNIISAFRYFQEDRGQFRVMESKGNDDLISASSPNVQEFIEYAKMYLNHVQERERVVEEYQFPVLYSQYSGMQLHARQLADMVLAVAEQPPLTDSERKSFDRFATAFGTTRKATSSDLCSALANYNDICRAIKAFPDLSLNSVLPAPCDVC